MSFRSLFIYAFVLSVLLLVGTAHVLRAASIEPDTGDYEGRNIAAVEIVLEGSPPDATAEADFLSRVKVAPNTPYSAVRVRESLQELFNSGRVASARVEVVEAANRSIRVRFIIRRQVLVGDVRIDLEGDVDKGVVSADEIRARLNMLDVGARVSEQTLKNNADLIQAYLRDRGFFRAEVEYNLEVTGGTRAVVTFRIRPGEQARVAAFNINVQGFDASGVKPELKLQPRAPFTRPLLGEDLTRIRQAIIALGYLAPQLNDPQVILDSASNQVTINLTGAIGPKVEVTVKNYELSDKTARELLPVRREGSIDQSAIIEGARRLRNRLQESGYFFAEVTPVCTITPALATSDIANGTPETCENLNSSELSGRNVNITYDVERGRRFKLTSIRIEGTNRISVEEIEGELRTQKANALGFIPLLGYGRGYTSLALLEQDKKTVTSIMRDLGYRHASVEVRQGVSINGENLIITFVVNEGPLTRVAGVEIRGNQIYTDKRLRDELKVVTGAPYSRSEARLDGDRILNLYAREGYVDAQMDFSIVELPTRTISADVREEQVRLIYTIKSEGDKVFISRIEILGNIKTKEQAILDAIPLKAGDVLRADNLTETERILYQTDAFRQVIIRTEPAGETASGYKQRNVIIEVEELKPRIREFGGGYSTENGPLGFFDIRNVNLFGKLRQGAIRLRASNRQQLLRLEYFDPRFRRYRKTEFAPLALSLQYQRDTSVTRFFRSTIDRGSSGIVQRLDEDGNPIDVLTGEPAGEPTINRFTFNAETQRVMDEQSRSILFLRYNYEDVRLFRTNSLLIADILRPDRAVRLSRLGATFVRDTRENCSDQNLRRSLTSNIGFNRSRCRYSQTDATNGDYLSVDYALALRQLGGNISFNKLQATYRRYYKIEKARGAVIAANMTLGLAQLFNPRDRNENGVIDEVDLTLPISERFFSGGSSTLRGFGYEEAGPRRVVFFPNRVFFNNNGDPVRLDPFTVPVGGNALAIVNLEARMPVTKDFQVVPFYDGGNVFRQIKDIFRREPRPGDDPNLFARWTHTVGLGIRVNTPFGGSIGVDYAFLLNPPEFILPTTSPEPSIFRLKRTQIHFRFTQAF